MRIWRTPLQKFSDEGIGCSSAEGTGAVRGKHWLENFTPKICKEFGILGHYTNHSWRAFQTTGLSQSGYSKMSITKESGHAAGSTSLDSYCVESDSQLTDKTRDLFAAVKAGKSCYDYKKEQKQLQSQQVALASNIAPSMTFNGTVNINIGGQHGIPADMLFLQNMMGAQNQPQSQLVQNNNYVHEHRGSVYNQRALTSASHAKRYEPAFSVPRRRFGSKLKGEYAMIDFVGPLEINMIKNMLEKGGNLEDKKFLEEPMNARVMAAFIAFLADSVLDAEAWESVRPKLEKSMKKKCKFYYNKVVKHSGN